MKVLLYGKNAQTISDLASSLGFEIVSSHPDMIISYGGDGTLLASEREFPNIPKLPIRDSKVCKKCSDHTEEALLKLLKEGRLKSEEKIKLEAVFEDHKLYALNEIVIRNLTPIHAIRFEVAINNRLITPKLITASPERSRLRPDVGEAKVKACAANELRSGLSLNNRKPRTLSPRKLIIGDGVVIATAFGSTGYFKSVTGKTFETGINLAFNNTTEKIEPLFLNKWDLIKIKIIRGPAALSVDNNPKIPTLKEYDEVKIKVSDKTTTIFVPETLRCSRCIIKKHQRLSEGY
ncbi:NAD(+)/NADH kinase [Candidatus Daviesbacteria bacterium]|nr:NAD(+)/NADH kinase [Candidatus Daviesbacteria bacterium]